MALNPDFPALDFASNHVPEQIKQRQFCAWGARHPTECYSGIGPHRRVLSEVPNEATRQQRSRQARTVCKASVAVTARHTGKNGENSKSVDCSMNEKTKLERRKREDENCCASDG